MRSSHSLGTNTWRGLPPWLCTRYSDACSSPRAQRQFGFPHRRRRGANVPRRKRWPETICVRRERRFRSPAGRLERDSGGFFIWYTNSISDRTRAVKQKTNANLVGQRGPSKAIAISEG